MTYVDPTKAAFAAFRENDRPGPVQMLNLVRFRQTAVYPDGERTSGEAAYRRYARASGPVFHRLGGRQVFVAAFEQTLIGPPDERWDLVFVAEYPSPEAFVAMLRDPEYREAVKHRQAAVEDSRLIRLSPRTPGALFGE